MWYFQVIYMPYYYTAFLLYFCLLHICLMGLVWIPTPVVFVIVVSKIIVLLVGCHIGLFWVVHIAWVCHVCCTIYVFCVLLGLILWSFVQLFLLIACVHCLPFPHVGKLLECPRPLHICYPFASIVHDSIISSIDMVGELVSSLFVYIFCSLLSAHPLAFVVPSLFSLWNIRVLSFSLHVTCHFCYVA